MVHGIYDIVRLRRSAAGLSDRWRLVLVGGWRLGELVLVVSFVVLWALAASFYSDPSTGSGPESEQSFILVVGLVGILHLMGAVELVLVIALSIRVIGGVGALDDETVPEVHWDEVSVRDLLRRPAPEMGTETEVLGRCLLAGVVDVVVWYVAIVSLGLLLARLADILFGVAATEPYAQVGFLVAGVGYYPAFEALWGRTVGKLLTGLVVVQRDGSPCTVRGALVRNLLRLVDVGVVGVGVAVMVASPQNRRVGDVGARTLVVRTA